MLAIVTSLGSTSRMSDGGLLVIATMLQKGALFVNTICVASTTGLYEWYYTIGLMTSVTDPWYS
jgi:hypothetical protein